MRVIKVNKEKTGLIYISCSCRFHHTTDNGVESTRITDKHVRFHSKQNQETKVEKYSEGILEKPKSPPVLFHSSVAKVVTDSSVLKDNERIFNDR